MAARGAVVFALALTLVGLGVRSARVSYANPARVWVVNQSVANALHGSPVDFSTAAGRAAVMANLDAFATASGGQVGQTAAAITVAGAPLILVETDGSGTPVALNGRGLSCSPACDAITTSVPDATDHFVVYTVNNAGAHTAGDTLVATAQQDSVTLDSSTITVVGQAHDMQLSIASGKTTIEDHAPSCLLTDSTTDPSRALARATYTDINGTALVGYGPGFSSSSPSIMQVAVPSAVTMLQADSQTTGEDVVCGANIGTATLSEVTLPNEVAGVSGTVTRTQLIKVIGSPVGGIAEEPDVSQLREPSRAGGGNGWQVALGGAAAAALIGAAGVYARRRRRS